MKNLERQVDFYRNILGLKLHWKDGGEGGLGVGGEDLLRLVEKPEAQRYQGTTGIYHFALRLPSRKELARAIARLFQLRYPNYPTDHVVSKSTYLDDAEGNNIELYIYSLEDGVMDTENGRLIVRRTDGTISSGRDPLDVDSLFSELSSRDNLEDPMPADTVMGHVHLYGSDLTESMRFYRDVLGFSEGMMALDFRMGDVGLDRPHVIAFNTWHGAEAPPPPLDSLGLRHFTIVLPNATELEKVLDRARGVGSPAKDVGQGILVWDPSQIAVLLTQDKPNAGDS